MRLITAQVGPLVAASANNIAQSQSPGAGAIILNGTTVVSGVAFLDVARRVLLTSGGNDSAITFTVKGTDWNGNTQSETLAGGNAAAVATALDFATITSVTHIGTVAGTLTVGTNGVASTRPVFLDEYAFPQVGIQADATGTVNYTVQYSYDDPNQVAIRTMASSGIADFIGQGFKSINWINAIDAALVNATTTIGSTIAVSPKLLRVVLNSGTGSVALKAMQLQRA